VEAPGVDATRVAVIGGGPGGLMVAERLAAVGVAVTVYEQMPSVGRKFLLAGRGGLNLTHSESLDRLLTRYGSASPTLAGSIAGFDADALRAWCADLGEPTFVGSSGRVFPESFRATPLLRAWLARLGELGVQVRVRHRWTGWQGFGVNQPESDLANDRSSVRLGRGGTRLLTFEGPDGAPATVEADAVVLALGGASWPRVGSDGRWVETLRGEGVSVSDLRAANSGFAVEWSATFVERFSGMPVKNVRLSCGEAWSRGEAVVTDTGLEGGGIYALGPSIRGRLDFDGYAELLIDLQPDRTVEQVATRLAKRRPKDSVSSVLSRTGGVSGVGIGLMREATQNRLPWSTDALAGLIKQVPIRLTGAEPIGRAISTAGGVAFEEIDERFMLVRRPGVFVVGEMLDWEAPTGGYLLQATFSTAVAAAAGVREWLGC